MAASLRVVRYTPRPLVSTDAAAATVVLAHRITQDSGAGLLASRASYRRLFRAWLRRALWWLLAAGLIVAGLVMASCERARAAEPLPDLRGVHETLDRVLPVLLSAEATANAATVHLISRGPAALLAQSRRAFPPPLAVPESVAAQAPGNGMLAAALLAQGRR